MPTNRRIKIRNTRPHLSEHAVRLFMLCAEIRAAGDDVEWEEKGGRRGELRDTRSELHRLLSLPPWAPSITDHMTADPPAHGCPLKETWEKTYALRQQLLAAAAEMELRDAAMLAAIAAKAKKQR
jgi:hypothetical protein